MKEPGPTAEYWAEEVTAALYDYAGLETREEFKAALSQHFRQIASAADTRPFKRALDPRGCPYRSGPDCLGVVSYCKLQPGHQGAHATESASPYILAQWAAERG